VNNKESVTRSKTVVNSITKVSELELVGKAKVIFDTSGLSIGGILCNFQFAISGDL
jgi:hypothetical protein